MEGTLDTILYPEREAWPRLMQRGITDTSAVRETVATVLADVRRRGDQALLEYEERFDGVTLTSLRVSEAEMAEAESLVGEPLKEALTVAAANIRRFHEAQRMQPISVVTTGGVTCSQRSAYSKSRAVCAGRNGSAVFHGADARHSGKNCRLPSDCALHASRPAGKNPPRHPIRRPNGRRDGNL